MKKLLLTRLATRSVLELAQTLARLGVGKGAKRVSKRKQTKATTDVKKKKLQEPTVRRRGWITASPVITLWHRI